MTSSRFTLAKGGITAMQLELAGPFPTRKVGYPDEADYAALEAYARERAEVIRDSEIEGQIQFTSNHATSPRRNP